MPNDAHALAYKPITELDALGAAPVSGDLLVVYDTSAGAVKSVDRDYLLAGTGVSATAAEIDQVADISAYQETVDAAGALSILKRVSKLEVVSGGAVTLAAPDATCQGYIKIIEMTDDDGDVTLALTNVVGGSSAATATFDAVGEQLVLIAGDAKWIVLKEQGVTLS